MSAQSRTMHLFPSPRCLKSRQDAATVRQTVPSVVFVAAKYLHAIFSDSQAVRVKSSSGGSVSSGSGEISVRKCCCTDMHMPKALLMPVALCLLLVGVGAAP